MDEARLPLTGWWRPKQAKPATGHAPNEGDLREAKITARGEWAKCCALPRCWPTAGPCSMSGS